jgi:hypothetical protein
LDQKGLRTVKFVLVAVCALATMAVLWKGTGSRPVVAETPDKVVETIYGLCMDKQYEATAQYYLGGPQYEADLRQSVCQKITEGASIKGSYVLTMDDSGDTVVIQTRNYRNADTKTDGRIIRWTLVPRGGRWLVAEVV